MSKRRVSSATPAVLWLRQNARGSAAAGSSSSSFASSSPPGAEWRCTPERSLNSTPIMPVPTAQPQRSPSASVGAMPASRIASSAAASAKRCERFVYLRSLRSAVITPGSKPFTSAAMRVVKPEASNSVIGAAPLFAPSSAAQVDATSLPTGVTSPTPVVALRQRGFGVARRGSGPRNFQPRARDQPPVAAGRKHRLDLAVGERRELDADLQRLSRVDERAHLDVGHPQRSRWRPMQRRGASREVERQRELGVEEQRRREHRAPRKVIAEERRGTGNGQHRAQLGPRYAIRDAAREALDAVEASGGRTRAAQQCEALAQGVGRIEVG